MIKNNNCNIEGIGHVRAFEVTADSLHVFIADEVSRLGGIYYTSDTYLDYENMLHNMGEGVGYIWSIRATGTWFMPILNYARSQPDQFSTPLIRYIVKRHGDTYNFTEYIKL